MDDIDKLFNVKIDRARLKTLEPVELSIHMLDLPAIRFRKVNTLKQALQHPNLQDRSDVLERLKDLYLEWGKNAEAESIARQLNSLSSKPAKSSHRHKKKKH